MHRRRFVKVISAASASTLLFGNMGCSKQDDATPETATTTTGSNLSLNSYQYETLSFLTRENIQMGQTYTDRAIAATDYRSSLDNLIRAIKDHGIWGNIITIYPHFPTTFIKEVKGGADLLKKNADAYDSRGSQTWEDTGLLQNSLPANFGWTASIIGNGPPYSNSVIGGTWDNTYTGIALSVSPYSYGNGTVLLRAGLAQAASPVYRYLNLLGF